MFESVENYELKTLLNLIKFQSNFLEGKKKQIKIKSRSGLYNYKVKVSQY